MSYDSTAETQHHIDKVRLNLSQITDNLEQRAIKHDRSKLEDPEKAYFDEWTPRLRDVEYDSPEYHSFLAALKPALDHHYEVNDHHPEHYTYGTDGLTGMSLLAILEMLADWKAASERMKEGSLGKSIIVNVDRFKISPEMEHKLWITAIELGHDGKLAYS
jgi:hypothetical protein